MTHPWRQAIAVAVAEKRIKPSAAPKLLDEYEQFFRLPAGAHIDISPEDTNRWRCAATYRRCWHQAKKRKNGMIRFWNLGAIV